MEHNNNNNNANAALESFRLTGFVRIPHDTLAHPRALVTLPGTGGDFIVTLVSATQAYVHSASYYDRTSLPFALESLRPAIVAGVEYPYLTAHLERNADTGAWTIDRYDRGGDRVDVARAGTFGQGAPATANGRRKVAAALVQALENVQELDPLAFAQAEAADALGDVQRGERAVAGMAEALREAQAALAPLRARYDAAVDALRAAANAADAIG